MVLGDPKEEPVILVQEKGKYGLTDRDGKVLLAPVLKKITDGGDGYLGGQAGKTWSFYNLKGEKLPGEYEEVKAFSEGLAPVKLKGKWSFADANGKVVIQPQYKEVHGFSEGLAAVKTDKQWFYIRKDGTVLPSVSAKKAGDFHQGVAVVDGGWLMDTTGKRYAKLKNMPTWATSRITAWPKWAYAGPATASWTTFPSAGAGETAGAGAVLTGASARAGGPIGVMWITATIITITTAGAGAVASACRRP